MGANHLLSGMIPLRILYKIHASNSHSLDLFVPCLEKVHKHILEKMLVKNGDESHRIPIP